MENKRDLWSKSKECKECGRPLPQKYTEDLCPRCEEMLLFRKVKEYIRSNTVNEYEVATHFGIPLTQVKSWIREGRIQYRDDSKKSIASLHCQRCGAPVSFGSLCPKCLNSMNHAHGYSSGTSSDSDQQMRFLNQDETES